MQRTIQSAVSICALPAIPTHNWCQLCAEALSQLSPHHITGVFLSTLQEADSSSFSLSSSVAAYKHAPTHQDNPHPPTRSRRLENQAHTSSTLLYINRLDRLTNLGIPLPKHTLERGLITQLSSLNRDWISTAIGKVFKPDHTTPELIASKSPVLTIIPIHPEEQGLVLGVLIAQSPQSQTATKQFMPDTVISQMAALYPAIADIASRALAEIRNPKAWLTDREYQILQHLIEGQSVRVIAEQLGRSTHTVHDHVKNLHKKIGANSRGELIAKALGHTPSHQPQPTQLRTPPLILSEHSLLTELKPSNRTAKPLHQHSDR